MFKLWFLIFASLHFSKGDDLACGPNQPKVINAIIQKNGFIYSPGFEKKQNYPNDVSCSYQIHVQKGWYNVIKQQHLHLQFNEFDISESDACKGDSLTLYDFKDGINGELVLKACGKQMLRDYVSKGPAVQLLFSSDFLGNSRGFNISYSSVLNPDLCPEENIECRNRKCVSSSLKCNGNDDCGDGTDEENCNRPVTVTDCGISAIQPLQSVDRVVGGVEAVPGSWPWMVDLQHRYFEPNGHVCGGTLLNAQWVLSAAHCFAELRTASMWRVHLGNHKKFETEAQEQVRYIQRLVIFDDIPEDQFARDGQFDINDDIALLKLNAPVEFTKYVQPACLPVPGRELYMGTICYAIGWGYTRGTGSSDALKQAFHPVQSDILCRRLVGEQFQSATMICAGSLQPQYGVCHGDSGGPLLCRINGKWNVMGVASYVTDTNFIDGLCGLEKRPSVFNKVSAKINYINRIINKYS